MAGDLYQYLNDPHRRDHVAGLDPRFADALNRLYAAAPADIRSQFRILSGFRSADRQKQLFDDAVAKYGSVSAARKWVAPPGRSQHNHGSAADLRYLSPAASQWVHANAASYGLRFPMAHEPWHIEPTWSRGGAGAGGGGQEAVSTPQTPVPAGDAGGGVAISGGGAPLSNSAMPAGAPNVIATGGAVGADRDLTPAARAPNPIADAFTAFAQGLAMQPPAAEGLLAARRRPQIVSVQDDPFSLGLGV